MPPRKATLPSPLHLEEPPLPDAVVRAYPNPFDILRAYVEAQFQRRLAIEHERTVALIAAEGHAVTDTASLTRIEALLVDVATHRKTIETFFKPLKDFAWRVHRLVCDRESEVLAPLGAWDVAARGNAHAYRREEERRRQLEERRLQEEARRAEQERLEAEAASLEARGEVALAADVLEHAISAPAPVVVVPSTLPTTRGVAYRANWQWRPIGGDTPENRARAEKLVPREFLQLSDRKLTAHAKAHGAAAKVPGIEFYDAGTVSVRS